MFTKTNVAAFILVFLLGIIAFAISVQRNRSHFPNSFVMKYAEFGPPNSPGELLGPESFQGDAQRADPISSDTIQVVVYRNIDLATVKRTYPAIAGKAVYIYVEYSQAVSYLDKQLEELKANNDDVEYKKLNETLISEFEESRAKIIQRLGS